LIYGIVTLMNPAPGAPILLVVVAWGVSCPVLVGVSVAWVDDGCGVAVVGTMTVVTVTVAVARTIGAVTVAVAGTVSIAWVCLTLVDRMEVVVGVGAAVPWVDQGTGVAVVGTMTIVGTMTVGTVTAAVARTIGTVTAAVARTIVSVTVAVTGTISIAKSIVTIAWVSLTLVDRMEVVVGV